jgi:hypothetical protein
MMEVIISAFTQSNKRKPQKISVRIIHPGRQKKAAENFSHDSQLST